MSSLLAMSAPKSAAKKEKDRPRVQVKLRQSLANPTECYEKGDVADVDLLAAHRMVRRGIAETVDGRPLPPLDAEDEKLAGTVKVRTVPGRAKGNRAIVEPEERAAAREAAEKEQKKADKGRKENTDDDDL